LVGGEAAVSEGRQPLGSDFRLGRPLLIQRKATEALRRQNLARWRWDMIAKDIMTVDVISVVPSMPIAEIAKRMIKEGVSALPVMDGRRLVGIVSEGDLLRRTETKTERKRSSWLQMLVSNSTLASEYVKSHGRTAADVMTRDVITVNETASLMDIANLLETKRIKRVPILRGDRVVGIVSRANLVRAVAAQPHQTGDTDAKDQQIREALLSELRKQSWAAGTSSSVVVNRGVVHLWGVVLSEAEKNATRVAAENITGVRKVIDHMVVEPFALSLMP
jgi:CBS domain-containing protein